MSALKFFLLFGLGIKCDFYQIYWEFYKEFKMESHTFIQIRCQEKWIA